MLEKFEYDPPTKSMNIIISFFQYQAVHYNEKNTQILSAYWYNECFSLSSFVTDSLPSDKCEKEVRF